MLEALYQELILDHNRRPRNFGVLSCPSHTARGHNPLCGDQITVQLRVEGSKITEVCFSGEGCAISKASASLMTESLLGKTRAQADALFASFQHLVTSAPEEHVLDMVLAETDGPEDMAADDSAPLALGKLAALAGVRSFPMRVKCATLAWHTLQAALRATPGDATPVHTE